MLSLVKDVREWKPTSALRHVEIEGETLSVTAGLSVWVNGKQWTLADQIKTDDRVHCVHASYPAEAVTNEVKPEFVYQLEVADTHCFFVGEKGALLHDLTPRTNRDVVAVGFDG